jgi:hypothetical protein
LAYTMQTMCFKQHQRCTFCHHPWTIPIRLKLLLIQVQLKPITIRVKYMSINEYFLLSFICTSKCPWSSDRAFFVFYFWIEIDLENELWFCF